MKLATVIFLLFGFTLFGQNQQISLLNNLYFSGEVNYRSYGTNDHSGVGSALEVSKDLKHWLGIGLNVGYWKNNQVDLNIRNPFTNERFVYNKEIEEFLISPFLQIFPVNTTHFDVYIQLGLKTGYYNQTHYNGRIAIDYDNEILYRDLYDVGNKGITLGYTAGAGVRLQFNRLILVPNIILISNDLNGDSFSALNLKIGWQL